MSVERRPLRRGQHGLRAQRGPAIIRVLASAGDPVAVPVIAERAGVPRSAAHGLLRHFERQGITEFRGNDCWALTERGNAYARTVLFRAMSEHAVI